MRVGENVRLGDKCEALLLVAFAAEFEGVAEAAVDAFTGVDARLRRHFVRRAFLEDAAETAVEVFGVLADDDEVDVFGLLAGERRFDAGIQANRAKVNVLIEREAEGEEQAALHDAGRYVRVADGAKVDGVELFEGGDAVGGERFAGAEVAFAAPVERFVLEAEAELLRGGVEDFASFGDDFGPGAVAGEKRDLVSFHRLVPAERGIVWRELRVVSCELRGRNA